MAKNNKRKASKTNPVSLITLADRTSPISEQYRTIRTNIQFATTNEQKIQTIVVTSSGPGEGKSTSSANLAVVFANAGQKVLLVDADMRKPTVFKTFRLTNTFGLSTLLSTAKKIAEIRQETTVENLFVLTSGPKPPNPSEMLGSPRMDQIIAEAKAEFDIVIFDMPPIVAVTDAQVMASKVDGTILVVRENVTQKESLTKSNHLLKMVNARMLGVVYNGVENSSDQGYNYYYGN